MCWVTTPYLNEQPVGNLPRFARQVGGRALLSPALHHDHPGECEDAMKGGRFGVLLALTIALCACKVVPLTTPDLVPTSTPAIPDGWQTYESLDHSFAFALPGDWTKRTEDANYASFEGPGSALLALGLGNGEGAGLNGTDEENAAWVARGLADSWSSQLKTLDFTELDRGVWRGGPAKGWFAVASEGVGLPSEEQKTVFTRYLVGFRVGEDLMMVQLSRAYVLGFRDEDYMLLEAICNTISTR